MYETKMSKYRLDGCGKVFRWEESRDCYMFYCTERALTNKEYREIKRNGNTSDGCIEEMERIEDIEEAESCGRGFYLY